MSYKNGKEILPADVLEEIQKYFAGGIIYIPMVEEQRKQWGTLTDTKEIIRQRNREIKAKKYQGSSIERLMEEYHLSYDTIKRIVYMKR